MSGPSAGGDPSGPPAGGDVPAPERPVQTDEVFAGPLFRVDVQRWPDPDRRRDVVRHPGAVAVLALTERDEVVLVRQLREAVGERLLEVPAGIFDREGESGEQLARRELLEETGHVAVALEPLGVVYTSPGFSDERIELFVARAERVADPAEEGLEIVHLPFGEALDAVRRGRIKDAKTVAALLLGAARR